MPSTCECRDACGPRVSAVGSMLQTSALWAWRLPRGLEHASHVLGRALWHALALTDASPRAPQVCSTSREDKRTGFTVPPQTTRDLLGHPRERERLGERSSSTRGEGGGGNGGARGKVYSKPTRVDATSDDQMMMISIVLFKKQTELSSMYLEDGTYLGDIRQDSHPSHRRRSSMGGRAILFSTWVPWQSFKTAHSLQARKNGRCSSTPLTVASWEPLMPRRLW
jgi:hypothetical protein